MLEAREADNSPPEATLSRRAKSYSDFYEIATAQFANNNGSKKKKDGVRRRGKDKTSWEALMIPDSLAALSLDTTEEIVHDDLLRDQLLEASQQEYLYVLLKYTAPFCLPPTDAQEDSIMINSL